jgi:hypothetical protein
MMSDLDECWGSFSWGGFSSSFFLWWVKGRWWGKSLSGELILFSFFWGWYFWYFNWSGWWWLGSFFSGGGFLIGIGHNFLEWCWGSDPEIVGVKNVLWHVSGPGISSGI